MPPGSRTPVLAGKAGVDAPTRHAQLSRKDQQHEAIVVKLSGMPFDPIYEIDDDTIAIGDLVRVPGSDSAFIEEGETGIVDIQVHQDSSSTQVTRRGRRSARPDADSWQAATRRPSGHQSPR